MTIRIDRVDVETYAAVVPLLATQLAEHAITIEREGLARAVRGLVEVPGRGAALVARSGHEVVGIAILAHTWTVEHGGKCTWLDELYVVPAHRGVGVGQALLHRAFEVASEEGCVAMDLEVDEEHLRAESLYARNGFLRRHRRRFYRPL